MSRNNLKSVSISNEQEDALVDAHRLKQDTELRESSVRSISRLDELGPMEISSDSIPSEDAVDQDTTIQLETIDGHNWMNGNVVYAFNAPFDLETIMHLGWATYTHSTRCLKDGTRVIVKMCFGAFECPQETCRYTIRPAQVKGSAKKIPGIRKKKSILCPTHQCVCILKNCDCRIIYRITEDEVVIEHEGVHAHRRPPSSNPTGPARERYVSVMKTARILRPEDLGSGEFTSIAPVSEVHESRANLGRIRDIRQQMLKETTPSNDLVSIYEWNKQLDDCFIRVLKLTNDVIVIILCTGFLAEKLKTEYQESPMQTDIIKGRIKSNSTQDNCLCATTFYSQALDRHIPVVAAIMFGQPESYFEEYFSFLLNSMNLRIDRNQLNFGGMTCDFSTAEWNGFSNAFKKLYPGHDPSDYHNTHKIHFKKSLKRFQSSNVFISADKKGAFFNDTMNFLTLTSVDEFEQSIELWKESYPMAVKWIDWYLNPCRRHFVFKAFMSSNKKEDMYSNTNVQEGICADLKKSLRHLPCEVGECLQDLYSYFKNIERDYEFTEQEIDVLTKSTQSKRKRRKIYVHDGRVPDTANT